MNINGFFYFCAWLFSSPWRVLLALLAWFALVALVAGVRHFFKWLFS